MKPVTILTPHGLLRGLYNVKAGLVSYVWAGVAEYVPASAIIPAILSKQAF